MTNADPSRTLSLVVDSGQCLRLVIAPVSVEQAFVRAAGDGAGTFEIGCGDDELGISMGQATICVWSRSQAGTISLDTGACVDLAFPKEFFGFIHSVMAAPEDGWWVVIGELEEMLLSPSGVTVDIASRGEPFVSIERCSPELFYVHQFDGRAVARSIVMREDGWRMIDGIA